MGRVIAGNRAVTLIALAMAAGLSSSAESATLPKTEKPKKRRKLCDLKTGKARL